MTFILHHLASIATSVIQAIFNTFAAMVQAIIDLWPFPMPDLPSIPSEVYTIYGWALWTPLPIVGALDLFFLLITVEIVWQGVAVALRWAKVIE
jgi:hypothetical protein